MPKGHCRFGVPNTWEPLNTQIGDSRRMPFKTFKKQASSKTRSTSQVGKCWKYVKSVTPILKPFRLFRSILGLLRIHKMVSFHSEGRWLLSISISPGCDSPLKHAKAICDHLEDQIGAGYTQVWIPFSRLRSIKTSSLDSGVFGSSLPRHWATAPKAPVLPLPVSAATNTSPAKVSTQKWRSSTCSTNENQENHHQRCGIHLQWPTKMRLCPEKSGSAVNDKIWKVWGPKLVDFTDRLGIGPTKIMA